MIKRKQKTTHKAITIHSSAPPQAGFSNGAFAHDHKIPQKFIHLHPLFSLAEFLLHFFLPFFGFFRRQQSIQSAIRVTKAFCF
ncbi:hypothetical protein L1987_53381 [Smallanthus sonchifolius]|uniref:Uncharacterized protein n=1 Tax=Smallanthus sonchifolius TaxID=185202 RepID=A0ACB9EV88_9ASTR|nr:hypothetical protein L1987_53381 [Smallanthus sonchifolius]